MGAFEYRQAQEIRDAFGRHGVRYLFIGKSGAILLGFPDTTPAEAGCKGAPAEAGLRTLWRTRCIVSRLQPAHFCTLL